MQYTLEQEQQQKTVKIRNKSERAQLFSNEKTKLVEKLKESRQKRLISRTKNMLQKLVEEPMPLGNRPILHKCREQDGSGVGWYKEIVTEFCEMRLEQDAKQIDLTKVFYNLHYDVDESDHQNSAPLLQDIKNDDYFGFVTNM